MLVDTDVVRGGQAGGAEAWSRPHDRQRCGSERDRELPRVVCRSKGNRWEIVDDFGAFPVPPH